MPLVTVPANMVPRLLTAAVAGPALCQASPDGDAGCPPSAWINVVIRPVNGAAGPSVTPDAAGQFLHPVFTFAAPHVDEGKRRATEKDSFLTSLPLATAARTALIVETDPGCYWVGTPCSVSYVGGTPGDVYDVAIEFVSVRQLRSQCSANVDLMEPAFSFALTSFFYTEGGSFMQFPVAGIALPQYHTHFEVVQGAARVVLAAGHVPLDASYGPSARIPLNLRSTSTGLIVSTGIYRTSGSF